MRVLKKKVFYEGELDRSKKLQLVVKLQPEEKNYKKNKELDFNVCVLNRGRC